MVGQILSYINVLDVNSPDELIKRIDGLINELPDGNDKSKALSTFIQKKKLIEKEQMFKKCENNIEKIDIKAEVKKISKEDENKKFDEEINEMVKQYLSNRPKNVSLNNKVKKENGVYISAYNLLRISNLKVKIYKMILHLRNTKNERKSIINGIPSLPILEEKDKIGKTYGTIPLGIYVCMNKNNIIISKDTLILKDDDKVIAQYFYSIDNYVVSLKDDKGNIRLLHLLDKQNNNYDVMENNKLIDTISYVGKII